MAKEGQGVPLLPLKTPFFCPFKLGFKEGMKYFSVQALPFLHYTTIQEGSMHFSILLFTSPSYSIISHSLLLFLNSQTTPNCK